MKSWFINPVLNKEIKLRFRSVKNYVGVACYLAFLALISFGFIGLQMSYDDLGVFRPAESQMMFLYLSMFQLALVIFITPGLTAGVISSERERQTLPILLTTAQTSTTIVLSKLFSSISYLFLIVFSSIPIYIIVFLFGGISPQNIIYSFALYIFTMFVIGAIGVMVSTLMRKTIMAMVTTYSIAFFLTGGIAVFTVILTSFSYEFSSQGQDFIWPFLFASVNIPVMFFSVFESTILDELQQLSGFNFSPWIIFYSFYSILTVLSLFIAVVKLRPKMKTKKTS
ncbi:ABC transporter permease protein [Bacillus sp. TS-2]|nr:ABC transporter permease protein [Bacillus sp. TS-2]